MKRKKKKLKYKYQDGGEPSPEKAARMLKDNSAHGHELTRKQQKYFGYLANKELGGQNMKNPYMNKGGKPCFECGGSMAEGGQPNFEPGNIFIKEKNNFLNWLKSTSMDALHNELDNQEGYHVMPDGTIMANSDMNDMGYMKKGGNWIPKNLKKGRCTPGSPNYDCPKGSPQWRLAQTFKKYHGFHETGGSIDFENYYNSGGGLSREDDYSSKKKPYPSVSAEDFAGPHRSYPIPTKADAIDALRLARLHHRPDVIAKIFNKYPELNTHEEGGEYKNGGNWIQSAVKHPGRCTPGSPNYDCPKGSPQWNLAQRFKHGDLHKKAEGGELFQNENNFEVDDIEHDSYCEGGMTYKKGGAKKKCACKKRKKKQVYLLVNPYGVSGNHWHQGPSGPPPPLPSPPPHPMHIKYGGENSLPDWLYEARGRAIENKEYSHGGYYQDGSEVGIPYAEGYHGPQGFTTSEGPVQNNFGPPYESQDQPLTKLPQRGLEQIPNNVLDTRIFNPIDQTSMWNVTNPGYPTKSSVKAPKKPSFLDKISGPQAVEAGLTGLEGLTYLFNTDERANRENYLKNQTRAENVFASNPSMGRGDYSVNEGYFRPDQYSFPQSQGAAGMGSYKSGGAYYNEGGMSPYDSNGQWRGNPVTPVYDSGQYSEPPLKGTFTLGPVKDGTQNLEAELGETVYVPDVDGLSAHYKIRGKKHSEGGTPLNLPNDSFIFSDTKDMKIKDPKILKFFGKNVKDNNKKGFTPAELAKKYDINKYRLQLANPDNQSDKVMINSAEKMIENYNIKLGKLALVQESKKGFPDGIPVIALPYLAKVGIQPDQVLPLRNPGQPEESQRQGKMMKNGGSNTGTWFDGNYFQEGGSKSKKKPSFINWQKTHNLPVPNLPKNVVDSLLQSQYQESQPSSTYKQFVSPRNYMIPEDKDTVITQTLDSSGLEDITNQNPTKDELRSLMDAGVHFIYYGKKY